MLAVDTNVVIRLLVRDDEAQYQAARRIFDQDTVFLAKTVLLEAEWVLRFRYRLQSSAITEALGALISLPDVQTEDTPAMRQALEWHREGTDFADALHLASSSRATGFLTFDLDMIKLARKFDLPVATP